MSFDDVMEGMRNSFSTSVKQNPALDKWKAAGKPAFGYMCNNFPEEILAAAGVLPLRFLGAPIDIVETNEYQSIFMCHYGRSVLELGLSGEYEKLDGLVSAYGCEGGCNLFQILMDVANLDYENFLNIPHNSDGPGAYEFYIEEMKSFRRSLEEHFNRDITDEDLSQSIELYNRQRRLLRTIYDLRGKEDIPLFTGTEVAEIMEYTMSVPKEEANEVLQQLIDTAKDRVFKPRVSGPRVLIEGTILPDRELYQMVEDLGGIVVGDGLCTGTRSFWDLVRQDLPPLEALCRYVLERLPCSCMSSHRVGERRVKHLWQQAQDYNATGVIIAVQKWCDPMQMDRPFTIEKLQEKGLSVLAVEIERTSGGSQLLTRLEAFVEMLGTRVGGVV